MNTLLAKDLRLNFGPFLAVVVLFLALPVAFFLAQAADEGFQRVLTADAACGALASGCAAALGCSLLVIPAFGGIAFARERRDRSAQFLASFPISRRRVIASKMLAVAIVCRPAPWFLCAIGFVPAYCINHLPLTGAVNGSFEPFGWFLVIQILLLGSSWLLSSLLPSEVLAASLSVLFAIICLVMYISYKSHAWRYGPQADALADEVAFHGAYLLGAASFAAGTVVMLKRVSP